MPATSEKQANFMRLVAYYKKHHSMPKGAGKATAKIKQAASSMSLQQITDFMHTKKKK